MKLAQIGVAVFVLGLALIPVDGFAKKRPAQSSNFTPTAEQRRKAWEQGLKDCRAKYGSNLQEVSVEKYYGKWNVVCYHY